MGTPEDRKRLHFVLGNVILGIAAVMLFFMGPLWELMGVGSLVLWMSLAATGVYLITKDRDVGPGGPPE